MKTIGDLIRLAREARSSTRGGWTQDQLAEKVGVSKQWISGIETGKKYPSLSLLVKLHSTLITESPLENSENQLSVWLLTWLQRQVDEENLRSEEKLTTHTIVEGAIEQMIKPLMSKPTPHRTLEYFPYPSEPLTVVCGDRRETKPKTRGDIFAYNVSITDLTFLFKLGLSEKVTIRSDKLFVFMGRDYLEREFGKTNLLVIGSPAVNFAARVINNYSVFRFSLPLWLKATEEQIRTLREEKGWDKDQLISLKELNDRRYLHIFWQLTQNPDDARFAADSEPHDRKFMELVESLQRRANFRTPVEADDVKKLARTAVKLLGGYSAKDFMNEFRIPGLVDLSDATLHAKTTRPDNDFALISLAPNPFSTEKNHNYVCIMVAGIHGPGTAHALRALAEDDFHDHPFGGIIEVEIDQFEDWPTRFQNASWRWQTKKYDSQKLLTNLKNALAQPKHLRPRVFENVTDPEIVDCIDFVEHISNRSRVPSGS